MPPSRPIGGAATEVRTIVFNKFPAVYPVSYLMDYLSLLSILLCFQYNRIGLIFTLDPALVKFVVVLLKVGVLSQDNFRRNLQI